MKYWFVIFCLPFQLLAQQYPQLGLFNANPIVYNAAAGATKNYTDIKLAYRQQWSGFEGSPQTLWASVSGSLQNFKRHLPERYHGFGAWLYADRIGISEQNAAGLSYSYHLTLHRSGGQDWRASMAFSLLYHQFSLNTQGIIVSDPLDNALPTSQIARAVDGALALWLYSKDFYLGFSLNHLAQSRMPSLSTQLNREYFLTGGYKFQFAHTDWCLVPSFLFKANTINNYQIDLSLILRFSDIFSVGTLWRYSEAVGGILGFNVAQAFDVHYNYEIPTGIFVGRHLGSHEIMMSFKLGNYKFRHKIKKPQSPLYD